MTWIGDTAQIVHSTAITIIGTLGIFWSADDGWGKVGVAWRSLEASKQTAGPTGNGVKSIYR